MPTFETQGGTSPGVTILNADGTVHTAHTTAGFTEAVAGSGVYNYPHPSPGTLLEFVFDATVDGTVMYASVWDDGLTVQAAAQAAIVAEDVADETTLAAVKAKTDNLPSAPAAIGDAMTLTEGERAAVADAVWADTTTAVASLTFRVLLDSDNDGTPDDPPVGVPDVRCLLFTDAAGTQPVGAVKLTDTQGYARWYGLAAGTYYMRREKAGMLFDDDPLVVEVVEPV